jgi:hypothetical protein
VELVNVLLEKDPVLERPLTNRTLKPGVITEVKHTKMPSDAVPVSQLCATNHANNAASCSVDLFVNETLELFLIRRDKGI